MYKLNNVISRFTLDGPAVFSLIQCNHDVLQRRGISEREEVVRHHTFVLVEGELVPVQLALRLRSLPLQNIALHEAIGEQQPLSVSAAITRIRDTSHESLRVVNI